MSYLKRRRVFCVETIVSQNLKNKLEGGPTRRTSLYMHINRGILRDSLSSGIRRSLGKI